MTAPLCPDCRIAMVRVDETGPGLLGDVPPLHGWECLECMEFVADTICGNCDRPKGLCVCDRDTDANAKEDGDAIAE